MAYLLRSLILLMILGNLATFLGAMGYIDFPMNHIYMAIPTFLYVIFAQAFVMFYFIGTSKLTENVYGALVHETNLHELFDEPPKDLDPYLKKGKRFYHDASLCKRQTIPWTMLILILGMLAFFLGGAHDTGLVSKTVHAGVVYGYLAALTIGFFRQWYFLGKAHVTLRKLKTLFSIPDASM